MAVTDAHKNANRRWDSENMTSVTTRLPKDIAEKFHNLVSQRGQSAHAVLKEFVLDYVVSSGKPETVGSRAEQAHMVHLTDKAWAVLERQSQESGVSPAVLGSAIIAEYLRRE